MAGYSTTDVRMGYALAEAWSLQLAVNNVFDKEYETASRYNQPGRNYLLTLRYHPAK
jgi:vitamin B12 transporter